MAVRGAVHTKTGPSVRRPSAATPHSKAVASVTAASSDGASGCVSRAVTKIECGRAAGFATRPKGRARNATHRPDSTSSSCTSAGLSPVGWRPVNAR